MLDEVRRFVCEHAGDAVVGNYVLSCMDSVRSDAHSYWEVDEPELTAHFWMYHPAAPDRRRETIRINIQTGKVQFVNDYFGVDVHADPYP